LLIELGGPALFCKSLNIRQSHVTFASAGARRNNGRYLRAEHGNRPAEAKGAGSMEGIRRGN
jgi:hypothetical protein